MYGLGARGRHARLLMVASDRISTYDAVHPHADPRQGQGADRALGVLVREDRHIVANHMLSATEDVPDPRAGARAGGAEAEDAAGGVRGARLHHRVGLEGLPGHRRVSGIELPAGLRESEQLPEPIFTPSTKAEVGPRRGDRLRAAAELVGDRELMRRVADVAVELYSFAAEHAREHGVILADTKFEFGLDEAGELVVGDEVLTPDSSRYWPADGYEIGAASPASTSSTCATGPAPAAGTSSPRRRPSPRRSWRAPARATSRPTNASPASPSRSGSTPNRRRR